MIIIPSNKKWNISYLGDFFGHIINGFKINLFKSLGRVSVGYKLIKNTVNDDIEDLSPAYGFTWATLKSGEEKIKKLWAIAKDKVLKFDTETYKFVEDTSEGLGEIDSGSDIISIKDDSEEDLESIQYYVTIGKNLTSAFQITGSGDNVKWAQQIKVIGYLKELNVYLAKVRTPSDSLKISICEDDEGVPSGTELAYIEKEGGLIDTSFKEFTFKEEDWSDKVYFEKDKIYWLVFSRTGDADVENFYLVKLAWGGDEDPKTDDPYVDGEIKNYNGTSWTKQTYTLRTDTFTSSGTWTVPSGVAEAYVECWGAGGGGTANVGGGGGGAYAAKLVQNLTPGSNISITVGTSLGNTDGGASIFGSNVVKAAGGKSGANGGTGGSTSDSIGDIKYAGGNGAQGTDARGGGGGAGNRGSGSNGASSYPGVGGSHNGGDGDGKPIGGGGTSDTSVGNAGANGEVRITYKTTVPEGYPAIKSVSFFKQFRDGYPFLDAYFRLPPNAMPGDLMVLIIACNGGSAISIGGWNKVCEGFGYNNSSYLGVFYKRVDGSENYITFTTPSSVSVSAIMYCIANADTPTGTAETNYSNQFDSPSHSLPTAKKALWLSIGSVVGSYIGIALAPPSNFTSMLFVPSGGIISYSGSPVGNRGACVVSSYRYYDGQTLDPGAYSSTVGYWGVGATVAIPYKENKYYYDLTALLKTYLPETTERIYITTKDDILMLDEEDNKWHSVWYGLLKQEKLNPEYPRIIKSWGLGEVIFVANDNKLHSMAKRASMYTDVELERVVVPTNYYANWMVVSKTAIFVGFTNKDSDKLPSIVLIYDPYTEYSRIVNIPNGATMGFLFHEICYIIDKKGIVYHWTGAQFAPVSYLPGHTSDRYIDLPHRNGFTVYNGELHMLWKGFYPYPSGVWRFDGEKFYHIGSIDERIELQETGALFYDGDNQLYAGAIYSNPTETSTEEISGIFSLDDNLSFCWFTTPRIYTPAIKQIWQNVAIKYLATIPEIEQNLASFEVKYRTIPSKIGESEETTPCKGRWIEKDTFECIDEDFWEMVNKNLIVAGDEIIIRSGEISTQVPLLHIVSLDADTKTITCDKEIEIPDNPYFTFSVENWRKVNFSSISSSHLSALASLDDQRAEWIQFKIVLYGNLKLEEIQLSSFADWLIDKK